MRYSLSSEQSLGRAASGQPSVRLYALATSHPAHSARLMLEHKRLEYRVSYLLPGLHPLQLRAAGFPGTTVPALQIDGRRVQGSRTISRVLEELAPEPRLFPSERAVRLEVEAAERWGEEELQEVPRRISLWALAHRQEMRRWLLEITGVPGARIAGALNLPLARAFARRSNASESRVRADLERLPGMIDRVDALIDRGVLDGEVPTAADFQIAPSIRTLMAFPQIRPVVEDRPAGRLAVRLLKRIPEPVSLELPPAWLGPLGS